MRLATANHEKHLETYLRQLERRPLTIIDAVGIIPFDAEAANLFFQLVSSRYERGSVIVTSNKPFTAWGEIFGDPVVAAATIDRLVHHGEILSPKGDSYRLRDKKLPDHKARSAPATVCVSVNGVISVCSLSFNESRFLPSVHRRQSEGRWLRHNQGLRTGQLAHRLLAACPGRTGQGNSGG